MIDKTTYEAIFYGPNVIAAGTPRTLEYVNGEYQKVVVIDFEENGESAHRTFRIGRETEEPIPYRFVDDEHDASESEADVPN